MPQAAAGRAGRKTRVYKTDTAMVNECLCKFLAHNLCCLIMSQLELGIDVLFWGETQAAQAEAASVPVATPVPTVAPTFPLPVPADNDVQRPAPRFSPFAGA